ncbi:MAG: mechanosensitive ion channel [Eubacterium sp.]|nr:mechanosensitive ion channel [Eubacterium sp.]MCM1305326.1 mechanosensitive ion channel [Butyrivibrio sp.]MCM1345122.1 mechanosensitive ion channel [Muribaculaceae bacterium]MCM1411637.1 mechanosensitive ion channel [Lachnospiraceae bacterium]
MRYVPGLAAAAQAENVEIIEEMEELMKPGVLKSYLSVLPEKALNLGIRALLAVVVFLIGVQLIKLVRSIVKKSMKRANAEVGAIQFVDSFVKAALYVMLVLTIASSFGLDAASIVAVLGSAGVAIGLAVQGSLSNLAGGVLILILKPFKVGDYIREDSSGKEGTVTEIQIFYTKLLTFDNQTVILPNGNLANNSLVNVSAEPHRRMDIRVGISYRADLKKAKEVLQQVLEEDEKTVKDRDRLVFVDELAESAVVLGVRCWFAQEDFWCGKWRVMENCKLALDEAGIEIPYNQLDVHVKSE